MRRDLHRLMAMLAESRTKELELPFAVEKRDLEILFIGRDGTVRRRSLRIYLPEDAPRPLPLVFVAHYEMPEHDALLGMYLEMGWAVSTVTGYTPEYNGILNEDNLIFNSAALATVRKQPDIDRKRIIVSGGSAGGYMTMMLSILHLGICASVSFSGIANIVFNMRYMQAVNGYNLQALAGLDEDERQDMAVLLERMPIPVMGAVSQQFAPILAKMEQDPGHPIWKESSPVCKADCFTNPMLFTHFTSDVLVPIDQLTRRYSNGLVGESLPEGFRLLLSEFLLEEELQRSLAENLSQADLAENVFPAPEESGQLIEIPYDIEKRFNIVVFDEGPVEAVAGHHKKLDLGSYDARAYMWEQFARTADRTNWLTAGKLVLLAERYAGKSVLLPGHDGVDDTIYGSVAVHRREVLDELSAYIGERTCEDSWRDVFREARNMRPDLAADLREIESRLTR